MAKRDSNEKVYGLMYRREVCIDPDDEIEICTNSHELACYVDPQTLPTRVTEVKVSKKGKVTVKKARADAESVIHENAKRAQGKLGIWTKAGRQPREEENRQPKVMYGGGLY